MSPRYAFRVALVGMGLFALGCSPDGTVAPAADRPTPSATVNLALGSALPSPTAVQMVRRSSPLPNDLTITRTIGPEGGLISIPGAGLIVAFSPGAVLGPTPITVTAYAGWYVAYGFGPHGLRFLAPVVVSQDMSMTTADASDAGTLFGGYTPDGVNTLASDGAAVVTETLRVRLTTIPVLGQPHLFSSFVVQHFSGYILAGG